jgi:hypothetical protein
MSRASLLVCAVLAACLLASPVLAEDPTSDEVQALKKELMELKELIKSQNERIQSQEEKLKEQELRVYDLQDYVTEPTPYEETIGGMHVDEVVERIKAEMPQPGDGFTLGGGKIKVTPYGFIRLDMAYDNSATANSAGNVIAVVFPEDVAGLPSPPVERDDDDQFNATATATRIGLNFAGPDFQDGKLRGKMEIDFDEVLDGGGDVTAHRIRMRHAYAELVYPSWSLLAGQTWDIVAPRIPYSLDCMVMWGRGNIGYRRPQLRLTKWWEKDGTKLTAQGSLNYTDRTAVDDVDLDGFNDGVDSGWPMLEGRLGLDTSLGERPFSVGISGVLGEKQADYPVAGPSNNKEDLDVWVVALDGKLTVIPGLLTLQGEVWTGENLGGLMGGVYQNIVDTGTDWDEVEATGGFVHAMITPRKGLLFNVGAGVDDVDGDNLGTLKITRNRSVFGNVIYTIVPNFDVGLELAYQETEWVGADEGDNVRVQTAFTYKF